MRPRKADYEPVDSVPEGLKWKPAPWAGVKPRGPGPRKPPSPWPWVNKARERQRARRAPLNVTTLFSTPGSLYMLVRKRDTGEATYFKRKDAESPASPKEKIDAEPERPKQQRFRVGAQCWYVDEGGRWYLCIVESRRPGFITLRCDTGWDDKHEAQWPFDGPVEISSASQAFKRIRKLKDRIT